MSRMSYEERLRRDRERSRRLAAQPGFVEKRRARERLLRERRRNAPPVDREKKTVLDAGPFHGWLDELFARHGSWEGIGDALGMDPSRLRSARTRPRVTLDLVDRATINTQTLLCELYPCLYEFDEEVAA